MDEKRMFSLSPNKVLLLLHFLLLCFLILVVWVTLSLPLIFFLMPPEIPTTNLTTVGAATCSINDGISQYHTSKVCRRELTEALLYHNCSPPSTKGILVSGISAEQVGLVLNGLEFLNQSQECKDKVAPFLCLHLFGLCGDTGIRLQPTSDQCVRIRDNTCYREWREAAMFNIELPDCSNLPLSAPSCENSGYNQDINDINDTVLDNPLSMEVKDGGVSDIQCREEFYIVNDTKCLPSCHSWSLYSRVDTITSDVLIILSAVIGFSASILAIVLSCLCHRRMLEFPLILIVYIVTDTLIIGATIIVSYFGRRSLFCSSVNISESLQKSTPYCVYSGMSFAYTSVQMTLWWLFHIIMLFFKILYPFHEISIGRSRKVKYLHAFFVCAGLLIPFVPIISSMVDFAIEIKDNTTNEVSFWSGGLGFGINSFPPTLCYGRDREVVFYSYILLIEIITAIGCTLLLIIIWSLHRNHIKRRKTNDSNTSLIGKPEIKLLIVCAYYIVLVAVALSSLTVATRNTETLQEALMRYFSCEQDGLDQNNPCSRNDIDKLLYPYLIAFSYVFIGLFPVFNMIYIVNVQEMRNTIKKWQRKTKFQDFPSMASIERNKSFQTDS